MAKGVTLKKILINSIKLIKPIGFVKWLLLHKNTASKSITNKPKKDGTAVLGWQQGFTFLELLIVAGIVGVLCAIAVPSYRDYTLRGQVIESLTLSAHIRQAIARYYQYTGSLPKDNFATGVAKPSDINGKYVKSITVDNGAVHVLFSDTEPHLAEQVVSLQPVYISGAPTTPIHFNCGYAKPDKGNRQQLGGENKTTVAKKWLPSVCR